MSRFVIAQISDLHCGSQFFDPMLLEAAVEEIRALKPDLVVVAGDLTQEGYATEFQTAHAALRPLMEELTTVVIPGNHDAKNVGYVHFQDYFGKGELAGKSDRLLYLAREGHPRRLTVVAVDSSKPDLAEGEVGRERYDWIRDSLSTPADFKIFALHHHLIPVPGTGRERNIVWDAGDVLSLLEEREVDLVLCGHKHVPHVWAIGGMLVVNSGTASSYRLRGYIRPSYNVINVSKASIDVMMIYPGTGDRPVATFDRVGGALDRNPDLKAMFSKSAWRW